ncbi:zinc finger MYM-type protein 1-like, partial [Aphis craccivora]
KRAILVFVRCSPNKQAIFNALQSEQELNSQTLRPFCPTRWCMSENGTKASGFLKQLHKYEFLFNTKVMINIFERIELLNVELQKISLNFHEVKIKIKNIISLIEQKRENGFDDIWLEISTKARELNIQEPSNQRPNKKPKRLVL